MELISAKMAFASAIVTKETEKDKLFHRFEKTFNRAITTATRSTGKSVISLRWVDFDGEEMLLNDDDILAELLDNIIIAGYDISLAYYNPTDYNPCGVVIAWGNNTREIIDEFFKTSKELHEGE